MKRTKCRGSASVWWLAGLVTAMALAVAGTYYLHYVEPAEPVCNGGIPDRDDTSSSKQYKQQLAEAAARHFQQARDHVPQVVETLTSLKTTAYITMLLAKDKVTDGTSARDHILEILEEPIIKCCDEAVAVYGSQLNHDILQEHLTSANLIHASGMLYSAGALTLEAVFLKTTIKAFYHVCHATIARLSGSYGTGAAAAVVDGPFPFGDLIGVVIATGGTALCVSDLIDAQDELTENLTHMLYEGIDAAEDACRRGVGL